MFTFNCLQTKAFLNFSILVARFNNFFRVESKKWRIKTLPLLIWGNSLIGNIALIKDMNPKMQVNSENSGRFQSSRVGPSCYINDLPVGWSYLEHSWSLQWAGQSLQSTDCWSEYLYRLLTTVLRAEHILCNALFWVADFSGIWYLVWTRSSMILKNCLFIVNWWIVFMCPKSPIGREERKG